MSSLENHFPTDERFQRITHQFALFIHWFGIMTNSSKNSPTDERFSTYISGHFSSAGVLFLRSQPPRRLPAQIRNSAR